MVLSVQEKSQHDSELVWIMELNESEPLSWRQELYPGSIMELENLHDAGQQSSVSDGIVVVKGKGTMGSPKRPKTDVSCRGQTNVQFAQPGGEHNPDRGKDYNGWNKGKHKRKFKLAKGDYVEDEKIVIDELLLF
jgi:hypothetical protein